MSQTRGNLRSAFTLVEVLLSVALLTMLVAFSVPVFQSFQYTDELDSSVTIAANAIRTAQQLSRSGQEDSGWGVRFASTTITVFKGASYATRDQAADINYSLPAGVAVGSTSDISFSELYALPAGTAVITFSRSGSAKQIAINTKGGLNYV